MAISAGRTAFVASTREQRVADGRAARAQVPRSSHAAWVPGKNRPDPVQLLATAARTRVPRLVPIWFGRMSMSPFAFFRGSAGVMARDLSTTPATGSRVQLCGDAHLSNFGVFATPERDRVFDVNDFDETLPGPWEWDVKRLTTSVILAGRQNGFPGRVTGRAARTAVAAYRRAMQTFARARYLETWYSHIDRKSVAEQVGREGRKVIDTSLREARRQTDLHAFPKLVRTVRGRPRISDDPPLIVHYDDPADAEDSRAFFDRYVATLPDERRMLLDRYHIADVAQKVVGVGSVGTVCSILLLMGDRDVEDPLFLQLKQASASALEPYAGASLYENHAQRVVVGQHLVQEASDIFLGWSTLRSRDFYFRQLRDMKFATNLASLRPKALAGQAELCGAALARAHARSGDPAFISGYLGGRDGFDRAIEQFAEAYADQTERDHAAFVRAIRRGRLEAQVDV
ncbi:MAG: DUF2252 domain-containing protein [Thermoplasmata archaeon]|nr:DUF2252 domain-containing protein [Thermoplasmata archaeon]